MNTNSGTVTVWQSGRLAPHLGSRRFEFGREQWLMTALLTLSVLVLAVFVGLLEKQVDRGELQHATQRSRAVAEGQCEADQPAELRGRCIALFNGDVAAAQAAPGVEPGKTLSEQDNSALAMTVSLVSAR